MALRGATVDEAGDDAADRAGGRLYELADGVVDEAGDDAAHRAGGRLFELADCVIDQSGDYAWRTALEGLCMSSPTAS